MDYQLIALDMDGTLLNSYHEITKECLESIHMALHCGKDVVIATGRSLSEMKPYLQQLKDIQLRYMILESGAVVYDMFNDKILFQKTFYKEDIDKIYEVYQKQDIMMHIFANGRSYALKSKMRNMEYYQMGKYQNMFLENVEPIEDIKAFLKENNGHIEKVNLYHRSSSEREKSIESFQDLDVAKIKVEISSLELTAKDVHKGLGLKHLCAKLHLSLSQTIMVGDSDNDLEILEIAGLAVAMANANENVKKIADVCVGDCEHHGVRDAIEKYLLKNQL